MGVDRHLSMRTHADEQAAPLPFTGGVHRRSQSAIALGTSCDHRSDPDISEIMSVHRWGSRCSGGAKGLRKVTLLASRDGARTCPPQFLPRRRGCLSA